MSAEGPKTETAEEKVRILLSRISDAEREFGIAFNNRNRVANPRLKAIAEDRMNMLLLSIVKYAVEGMPKEYILPYPDWVKNNQEKITQLLQTPGILPSTAQEVAQLNASVMNTNKAPNPEPRGAPQPNPYTPQQQAQERARREAHQRAQREAQAEQEKQEREASAEAVAQRKSAFESVMKDPEAILKEYKSILGFGRMQAKLSTKGKSSRSDIENIVKLFTILKNDNEADWQENARAAYCYVKAIFDKYNVGLYGDHYAIKHQDPVADACYYHLQNLAKAVTTDYNNVDNLFQGNKSRDYVQRCEEKLHNVDNENRNKPRR